MKNNLTIPDNDYLSKINKIINFVKHTDKISGLLFCVCNNRRIIQEINNTIINRVLHQNINIIEINLIKNESIVIQLQQIIKENKTVSAVIINNFDEMIEGNNSEFLSHFNFCRESIFDLNIPIIIWVKKDNISRLANKAQDIYLRRDRANIYFSDNEIPYISTNDEINDYVSFDYIESSKYTDIKLKIEILENQLKNAEENKDSRLRIAKEIVLNLIDVYINANLINHAKKLYDKYSDCFNENTKLKENLMHKNLKTVLENLMNINYL